MALEAELAKQKSWYQNSMEAAYFCSYLICLKEFPLSMPCSWHALLCVSLCDRIDRLTHTRKKFALFQIEEMRVKVFKKWAGMYHCLSLWNTRFGAPVGRSHTACVCLTDPHLEDPVQGWDCKGTCPLGFRACKCIPQVRQVIYQTSCGVLKLRVSHRQGGVGVGWGGVATLEPGTGVIFRLQLMSRVSLRQFDAMKSPV